MKGALTCPLETRLNLRRPLGPRSEGNAFLYSPGSFSSLLSLRAHSLDTADNCEEPSGDHGRKRQVSGGREQVIEMQMKQDFLGNRTSGRVHQGAKTAGSPPPPPAPSPEPFRQHPNPYHQTPNTCTSYRSSQLVGNTRREKAFYSRHAASRNHPKPLKTRPKLFSTRDTSTPFSKKKRNENKRRKSPPRRPASLDRDTATKYHRRNSLKTRPKKSRSARERRCNSLKTKREKMGSTRARRK